MCTSTGETGAGHVDTSLFSPKHATMLPCDRDHSAWMVVTTWLQKCIDGTGRRMARLWVALQRGVHLEEDAHLEGRVIEECCSHLSGDPKGYKQEKRDGR